MSLINSIDLHHLVQNIKSWAKALGFNDVGISDIDLAKHEAALQAWLDQRYYGSMEFFPQRGMMRARPAELVPGTVRIIAVRMDYLPPNAAFAEHLANTKVGYISRYALGRDYHKVVRSKLKQLGQQIEHYLNDNTSNDDFAYRPFVDSAPILEHAVAEKAGLGFTGKHSLTIHPEQGSWFFLGELFINLPLPVDQPLAADCGTCSACISICPTGAIVEPYVIDARKCISYLTIEHDGSIDEVYRKAMGNRIYGCDDCQLVCPYNQYSELTTEADFHARPALFGAELLDLFAWDEATFLSQTEGSPIRRIGFAKWQRNISVALGNTDYDPENVQVLTHKLTCLTNHNFKAYGFSNEPNAAVQSMLHEHLTWALAEQQQAQNKKPVTNRQQAR
ncbi:MAG: tRNA epoxyqueuosine(34) reductase QueG, partial [Glaciecola sp.]